MSRHRFAGSRNVKPATHEERLASLEAHLQSLIAERGPDHWLTRQQQIMVNREKAGLPLLALTKGARPD